ncbi:PEP-utilizing enzyme [Arthrobacter sp. 24S4-2]|uniref:PEP-utilizing enzyme n=1 Tax=Arthrobacter sp. 24S4-2 TaxID=2575374 RepID=UPI0020C79627|nr:PEP-utilizing enzyme [Arthrobacter sp. 24S4-2]
MPDPRQVSRPRPLAGSGLARTTAETDPDWVPVTERAAGIITDHGGPVSHAAIVSRARGAGDCRHRQCNVGPHGKANGICGQGPWDHPDFAAFLIREGIDSLSLNPDSFLHTLHIVAHPESRM